MQPHSPTLPWPDTAPRRSETIGAFYAYLGYLLTFLAVRSRDDIAAAALLRNMRRLTPNIKRNAKQLASYRKARAMAPALHYPAQLEAGEFCHVLELACDGGLWNAGLVRAARAVDIRYLAHESRNLLREQLIAEGVYPPRATTPLDPGVILTRFVDVLIDCARGSLHREIAPRWLSHRPRASLRARQPLSAVA